MVLTAPTVDGLTLSLTQEIHVRSSLTTDFCGAPRANRTGE